MTQTVTDLLSILTIVAQISVIFLIISLVVSRTTKKPNVVTEFIKDNALLLAFVTALFSMTGSLFFSDFAGFEPCVLCWYQRILMYPQVLILGLALWKKEASLELVSMIMSALGVILAAYHYLGQVAVISNLPCAAIGYSSSCSQRFFMEYGYITIPMMSLSAFALILTVLLVKKLSK